MNEDVGFTTGLPQLTVSWASPVTVDESKSPDRTVTTVLSSSPESWLSEGLDVMPKIDRDGRSAFLPEGERGRHALGVMLEGRFQSMFAGQRSPLLNVPDAEGDIEESADAESGSGADDTLGVVSSVIDFSPESARLILFASNTFLADQVLRLVGSAEGVIYSNTPQLMANIVDWTLEDRSLLSIRSRGHFNRTLPPLPESEQLVLEMLNYLLAILGVAVVFGVHRQRLGRLRARYGSWLAGVEA
jgi:ABC-2 type transport system permease protein